jgi:alpha-methylacyl-CoA racemase
VVIESFRPGVADRLGIGYNVVHKRNKRIVYASVTGYGQNGPSAGWAGHDINYLAVGGYLATQGNALPGATVADSAGGGMHAAVSILAALLRREKWASGAYLDVSTTNGVLFLMALQIDQYLATGEEAKPGTTLLTGKYACYDVYECRDGKAISVGAIEAQFFRNLCEALGLPDLATAQFDDDRQDEVREALRNAFAQKDRDAWVQELAPKDTCVAPVLSVAEAAEVFPTLEVELDDHRRFRQLGSTIAGSVEPGFREARTER